VNITDIIINQIKTACKRIGYTIPENEIVTFGIRNNDMTAGIFNDTLGWFKINGNDSIIAVNTGTVDPGAYYLNHPMNAKGTAVMVAGVHKKAYKSGYHSKYKALRQCKRIKCYRITRPMFEAMNKDVPKGQWKIHLTGLLPSYLVTGANQHRASKWNITTKIGLYGAGCQVRNNPKQYAKFIKNVWGKQDYFDYVLFLEKDFNFIGNLDPKEQPTV